MSQMLDGEQVSDKECDGDGQYVWMCKWVKCQNISRRKYLMSRNDSRNFD